MLEVTPYEETWGYKWRCACGYIDVKSLPDTANTKCHICNTQMTHVVPPVKRG